ncbi:hypothetical protein KFE25_006709 [Diacronema lutheri]|uniref:Uncharacterized protein n=1 Tax=Diacronema lutheri TaxID=2081491 RepID=A0A8J5XSK9_DIALT|nr:hypothetical protein KFE25_006709 [Diacronema lutheri]
MDDRQREQIRELFNFLDVNRDSVISPKLAVHLALKLGFEITIEEMDPSEGLTLEDVLEEIETAFMRSQREPTERLSQIFSLTAGSSTFVNVGHVRSVLEGAQTGLLEGQGGPPSDVELQNLIDTMAFNYRPDVNHATRREFDEFLTVLGPRTLRLHEPFDARPDESMADFASRAAIERPRDIQLIARTGVKSQQTSGRLAHELPAHETLGAQRALG